MDEKVQPRLVSDPESKIVDAGESRAMQNDERLGFVTDPDGADYDVDFYGLRELAVAISGPIPRNGFARIPEVFRASAANPDEALAIVRNWLEGHPGWSARLIEKVYVACTIYRAGFDEERSFEVRTADGTTFKGLAPVGYFRGPDRKPLSGPPSARGIEGWVAGRLVDREGHEVTVSVPREGLVTVHEKLLEKRSERLPVAS
jgi:hypothetical protein